MATRPVMNLADRVAILILLVMVLVATLTFRDYGLGWDDYTHSEYGDLLLRLYASGFADTRALSFVNLYKYGGGFDIGAALAAKVVPFSLFETRRLVGAAVGIIGLLATWRLGRRIGGPVTGLAALALLATCPLYYGHMFINAKDAPFAAAMIVLLLSVVRAFDEYPNPSARTMVLVGVAIGAAFGTRILAVVAAPYVAFGLIMIAAADLPALRGRASAKRLAHFLVRMLPALVIAYLIMALLWPWSAVEPLNPLHAAIYFDSFFEKPWRELYQGAAIPVTEMPPDYLPRLFAYKLPLLMLALGLGGLAGMAIAILRPDTTPKRRAGLFVIAMAALLPIAIALVSRPALYNGIRHFIFLVPPFAVAGGLAVCWVVGWLSKRGRAAPAGFAALFVGGMALPTVDMVRLHPYQYVYYNELVGGVPGAYDKFMLDYWGLAFKQAGEALRESVDARGEAKPADRRWRVAVCGPQRGPQVALGPDYETTADPRGADFVMALGTFYCRTLDAPLVAEIKREDVVFARVYDIRGRDVTDLLVYRPP